MHWNVMKIIFYDEIKYFFLTRKQLSSLFICKLFYLFWWLEIIYTLCIKLKTINFNTSCICCWNAARDLRAVSPASEMEEIFDRKTDQKSFARQSPDVDIGTADKNDKVSKLFVRLAVPQLCENLLLSFPVTKLRDSFEFL